jgi:hypothetical protein
MTREEKDQDQDQLKMVLDADGWRGEVIQVVIPSDST